MESTNNLQSLDTCSNCYGIHGTPSWSPQFSLNIAGGKLKNEMVEEGASRSRDSTEKKDRGVVSGYRMSMIHDGACAGAGYEYDHHQYWGASDDAESCSLSTTTHSNPHTHYFSNKKDQHMCFPTFTTTTTDHGWSNRSEDHDRDDDFKDEPFLNSPDLYSTTTTLAGFGATSNISNININMNMNMNMQSSLSLFMHHHIDTSSIHSSTYPSQLANGVVEAKRPNALMESKPSQSQTASKKIRPESRSSCPPLKVRKEKLGDRIAALQQLVAPFGKTDTASVLMEAIGYIKFLQNQVETLSVPYMKSSSRNQNNRVMQAGSGKDCAGETAKRDLRSRGLCLVPLSCMSYITGDHAPPAMWNQPNFGGPT